MVQYGVKKVQEAITDTYRLFDGVNAIVQKCIPLDFSFQKWHVPPF